MTIDCFTGAGLGSRGNGRGRGRGRGCPRGRGRNTNTKDVSETLSGSCGTTRPQELSFSPPGHNQLRGRHRFAALK